MIKSFTSFLAGLVTAGALSVMAAPGDIIYEKQSEPVQITAADAAQAADWAIAKGCWDGDRASMTHLQIWRGTNNGESVFGCRVSGLKADAPANVPIGVTVHGIQQ